MERLDLTGRPAPALRKLPDAHERHRGGLLAPNEPQEEGFLSWAGLTHNKQVVYLCFGKKKKTASRQWKADAILVGATSPLIVTELSTSPSTFLHCLFMCLLFEAPLPPLFWWLCTAIKCIVNMSILPLLLFALLLPMPPLKGTVTMTTCRRTTKVNNRLQSCPCKMGSYTLCAVVLRENNIEKPLKLNRV